VQARITLYEAVPYPFKPHGVKNSGTAVRHRSKRATKGDAFFGLTRNRMPTER